VGYFVKQAIIHQAKDILKVTDGSSLQHMAFDGCGGPKNHSTSCAHKKTESNA
jgi:hypothetical protein